MDKVAVPHTLLLIGTLYRDKLKLLRELGAGPKNSVVYSAWASDVYDEDSEKTGQEWDVDTTGTITLYEFPTPIFVIIDEINLKTQPNPATMEKLFANPNVTVLVIATSVRSIYPTTRNHFKRVYAVERFQREKVFHLVYPQAPIASKNELVCWNV